MDVEILQMRGDASEFDTRKGAQDELIGERIAPFQFLESVTERSHEFNEVKDILLRFDTLLAANRELLNRAQEAQAQTETNRDFYSANIKVVYINQEKTNVILDRKNELSQ